MSQDVYTELAVDLVKECKLNMFTARKIVDFLKHEGYLDHCRLKEDYLGFYLGEEENEG
jgi:hypothetical protein